MAVTVREIERKYSVDGAPGVPDLEGLPGIESIDEPQHSRLDATYLDTVDLRLAARGVTLRRRTGGADAGWHLKLPAGGDARDEVREPLGRSARTVPPRLSSLVTAYARGAELVPVARVRTQRSERALRGADGAVLATVTNDVVRAQRLMGDAATLEAWNEIEVELGEGAGGDGPVLLDAVESRLLAAGATFSEVASKALRVLGPGVVPPWPAAPRRFGKRATAGDVVATYLRQHTATLLAWDPRVRLDEHDSVHKMRVATRRLRSTLRSFAPLLDSAAVVSLASELRWLTGELGAVRDGEVLYAALRADVDALPVELVLGPVAARLQTDVLAPTLRARESLLETLSSTRYAELLDTLDALCAQPPFLPAAAEPAREVLPQLLRRVLRTTRRQLAVAAALPAPERDDAAHRARRSAKRLRYAAEAVADVVGTPATRLTTLAEEVQEVLGAHQDDAVARAELRRVALRAHAAGENTLTYGVLIGRTAARADHLAADVERMHSALDKRSLRRALHAR